MTLSLGASSQGISYPDSSVLSYGNWYKFAISSSGLYKITYEDFISMGVKPEEIKSQNLSIYGNGALPINVDNSLNNTTDLIENSIYVYDPNNNFAQGGYVIFYAQGGNKLNYDKNKRTWSFKLNPYTDLSYYFVTFNDSIGEKKRVETIDNTSLLCDTTINYARDFSLSKQEISNIEEAGQQWVGKQLANQKAEQYPLDIRNAFTDDNNLLIKPASLQYRLVTKTPTNAYFIFNFNNILTDTIHFSALTSSGEAIKQEKLVEKEITQLNITNNRANITFNGEALSKGWLDYIIVNYDKSLRYNYPSILQYSTTEFLSLNLNVEHIISNVLNQNLVVWDVTNFKNPVSILGTYNSNEKTYSIKLNSDSLKNIVAFNYNSSFGTIKPIGKVENQNLHGTEAVDYVIITNPLFVEQAERLALLHREHNNTTTKVVTTEQIYNEFSSGNPDFLAYREYLRMLYKKYLPIGKNPKNVVLFGDGTFDNKNILKYNNNFILTFQADNTSTSKDLHPCEDFLGYLSDSAKGKYDYRYRDSLMIGIGRMPINSIEQAKLLVDKSERYLLKEDIFKESNVTDWRNYSVLTADDNDGGADYIFVQHAENIYNQTKAEQPQINAIKIYSDAYRQNASSSGNTYPDASKAINQQMKKGCLIFNYVGHGSEDHLSSERLITITDMVSWNNFYSMPLMITSTCEFARFDMVYKPSAAEEALNSENGGMIAIISASRPIGSDDAMNRNFHRYTLEKLPNHTTRTFGQAFSATKNDKTIPMNTDKRSVVLLGDPALRISLPKYEVITTSIDGIDPQIKNDTLRALANVTIKGKIVDDSSNIVNNFNGKIIITLFDKSSNYYTLNNENNGSVLEFEQQKNAINKGRADVINGEFTYSFTMPKDIAYNYGYGKLSYYAYGDSVDAGGYCNSFVVGGIDNSVVIQETRPDIKLFVGDSNFISGGITNENPELFAIVSDEIAINTVGSGLGHDITARLDNAANTFILNDYFEEDLNQENRGYIRFPFYSLTEGEHTLTLKVWNIFNFSSSKTITFNVISKNKETFKNLRNYPNPFKDYTNFFLEHNQNEKILSCQIQIFNSTGQMVKKINVNNPSQGYTIGPIRWDGTADGGEKLKQGVYIYRILINKSNSSEYTKSQKLVIF